MVEMALKFQKCLIVQKWFKLNDRQLSMPLYDPWNSLIYDGTKHDGSNVTSGFWQIVRDFQINLWIDGVHRTSKRQRKYKVHFVLFTDWIAREELLGFINTIVGYSIQLKLVLMLRTSFNLKIFSDFHFWVTFNHFEMKNYSNI